MIKNWSIYDLIRKRISYKKLLNKEHDYTGQLKLMDTIASIDDVIRYHLNLDFNIRKTNHFDCIISDYNFFKEYRDYISIVKNFKKQTNYLNFKCDELQYVHTTKNNIVSLTNSFYKNINEKYYKLFRNIVYNDNIKVKFMMNESNNEFGHTFPIYRSSDLYIAIGINRTMQDYVTAAHECGHGIICQMNNEEMFDINKYCFLEVGTLFFEILNVDYIGEKLNLEEEALKIQVETFNNYIYDAKLVSYKLNLYKHLSKKELKNKEIVINYLKHKCKLGDKVINDVLNTEASDFFHYIVSYLTAIELYLIYINNKELALGLLNKIINMKLTTEDTFSYLEEICNLGINPGKNVNKYVDILKDRIKENDYGKKLYNRH